MQRLSEGLAQRGHRVTVATTKLTKRNSRRINEVDIVEFNIAGNEVRGFRGDVKSYRDFLLEGDFDIMMNYAAQQWTSDLAFTVLPKLKYKKVLAPCGFSGLLDPAYQAYFSRMPATLNQYDHLVFHSRTYQDAVFAENCGISHFSAITNGASEDEFASEDVGVEFRRRYRIPPDVPIILTVGNHDPLKGHKHVIDAFTRSRIDRSVLIIVGGAHGIRSCKFSCLARAQYARVTSIGKKRILVLEVPRSTVISAFRAADLFVLGSELECSPLVLFESMASKTAFISTDCGNAKEISEWGGSGIVVGDKKTPDGRVVVEPAILALHIENLLKNHELRHWLAEAGYRAWKERFTWGYVVRRYEELYETLLGAEGSGGN